MEGLRGFQRIFANAVFVGARRTVYLVSCNHSQQRPIAALADIQGNLPPPRSTSRGVDQTAEKHVCREDESGANEPSDQIENTVSESAHSSFCCLQHDLQNPFTGVRNPSAVQWKQHLTPVCSHSLRSRDSLWFANARGCDASWTAGGLVYKHTCAEAVALEEASSDSSEVRFSPSTDARPDFPSETTKPHPIFSAAALAPEPAVPLPHFPVSETPSKATDLRPERLSVSDSPPPETKVCVVCDNEWGAADFGWRKTSPDGLDNRCRGCYAVQSYAARGMVLPGLHVAEKYCRDCKEMRPGSFFAAAAHRPDGLQPFCRSCAAQFHQRRLPALAAARAQDVAPATTVCRICARELPTERFFRDAYAVTGRTNVCPECVGARVKVWRKQVGPNREKRVDAKRCAHCQDVKPAGEFFAQIWSPDGLAYRCKACAELLRKPRSGRARGLGVLAEEASPGGVGQSPEGVGGDERQGEGGGDESPVVLVRVAELKELESEKSPRSLGATLA